MFLTRDLSELAQLTYSLTFLVLTALYELYAGYSSPNSSLQTETRHTLEQWLTTPFVHRLSVPTHVPPLLRLAELPSPLCAGTKKPAQQPGWRVEPDILDLIQSRHPQSGRARKCCVVSSPFHIAIITEINMEAYFHHEEENASWQVQIMRLKSPNIGGKVKIMWKKVQIMSIIL